MFLVLLVGCATPCEFDTRSRTIQPSSTEPITLAPGWYDILFPGRQKARLIVEGCGAIHIDTISEDHNTVANTLVYGPEPRIMVRLGRTNDTTLVNCVFISDGTNTSIFSSGGGETRFILNEPSAEHMQQFELYEDGNDIWKLKKLPNQSMEADKQ